MDETAQNRWNRSIAASVFTAMSIIAGIFAFLWEANENRALARQQSTLDFLFLRYSDDSIDTIIKAYEAVDRGPEIDGSSYNSQIAELLNLYEFVGLSVRKSAFDGELIMDHRRTAIVRAYCLNRNYIQGRRAANNNGKLYEHLEWLAVEYGEADCGPAPPLPGPSLTRAGPTSTTVLGD